MRTFNGDMCAVKAARSTLHSLFAACAVSVLVAACGADASSPEPSPNPQGNAQNADSGVVVIAEADAGSTETPADAGVLAQDSGVPPVVNTGATPATRGSTMAAELQAVGLDPANLPLFEDMMADIEATQNHDKLIGVMRSFNAALGVRCTHCHSVNGEDGRPDFGAPTPNKQIAAGMWDRFARDMKRTDGAIQYCDSCHQGQAKFLDRSDLRALGGWMHTYFVNGQTDAQGAALTCNTCHGTPMVLKFLDSWVSIPE